MNNFQEQWAKVRGKWAAFSAKRENWMAVSIILLGLFVGSLFVDAGQLVTGSGFSGRVVRAYDVLVTGGKTWVAYGEPKVSLRVVSDETCLECDPSEALMWIRRIVPTIEAERVDINTERGASLAENYHLTTLPAFVFGPEVGTTDFFVQAEPLFRAEGEWYVFDMNRIGMPVGRYLVAPESHPDDIVLGNADASLTMTVFTDFQCQFCSEFHQTTKEVLKNYGERIRIAVKHMPLPTHPQAADAAHAAQCAADQNQFVAYADILFARQSEWGRAMNTNQLKNYAYRIPGMDGRAFATCMDAGTYVDKVNADFDLAQSLTISATPAIFVDRQFISGAIPYEDLKAVLDETLSE